MATNRRPFTSMTIGLSMEGSQFTQTLKNINQQVKLAESNMKANLKILGNAEKSYDDLSKSLKDIQKTYDVQEKKMRALNRAYDEAVEQYGENSAQARKYATQINNLAGTMAVLDRQVKATTREMVYLEEGVEDTKKAMAKANKETDEMVKAYRAAGRQAEALAEEQKGYARQLAQTEDLMKKQERVIQRMTDEFGENSDEVRKARQSYENLGSSLRTLEVRLDGTTDKLKEMGYEGAQAQRDLQRELTRTETEIRDLERAMSRMDAGSQAFQNAERRAQQLRTSLGRTEQEAEQLQSALREVGNQQIDTSNIDKVGDRLDNLSNKAGLAGVALAGALGAVSAGVLSQIDQAIEKIGTLAGGVKEYKNSLRQGVKDSSYSRQASIYGIRGTGDTSGAKVLENIGTMTGFDAPEVGKAMNLLMKQFGMTQKMAQDTLIRASRQGLTELDELVEYLGAQETNKLDTKAKQDLANFMINGATKAIQAGGARNTDNALDFYNEVFVRALDKDNETIRNQWSEAGGKKALEAMEQFAKDGDVSKLMKNLDDAVVSKWGDNEVAQRAAWQQISGTQAEMVNMDGIRALVNGDKAMKVEVQQFDKDGNPVLDSKGNPVYKSKEVEGTISTEDQALLDAQNRFDKVAGSWKATMLNFSADLIPVLEPIIKDLTKWLEKHGATAAKNLSDFIAGFVDFFQGLFGGIAKIQEKLSGEANWKSLGDFAGLLATVGLAFKVLTPLFKMIKATSGATSKILKSDKGQMAIRATNIGVGKAWGATKRGASKVWNKLGGGGGPMGIVPGDPVARQRRTEMAINAREATKRGVGKVAGGVGNVAKGAVGAVGKAGKGIGGLAKGAVGLAGGPVGLLMMAIPLIIPLIKKLYTNFEPFKNLVDGTWAKLKEFWAWLQPMLVQAGVWIKEKLVGAWEAIKPALQSTWETIKTVVSAIWTFLQPIFMGMWNLIKTVFTGIWNTIKTVFGYVWTFLQPLLVSLWNLYKTYFTFIWSLIKTVFTGIWNIIKTVFTFVKDFIFTTVPTIYNNIKTGFNNIWTKTKETFSNVKNNIVGAFNYVKEKVIGFKDAMVGRFGDIKDGIVNKVSDIVADVKAMPGKIADGLANGANALKRGGAKMINGLVGAVEGGINKVISGINTAMGWFGISKKLGEVKFGRMSVGGDGKTGGGYVPQYARGTRGKPHPGGPALVNDAKGSSYREYIEFPNGKGFIPKGRNLMLDLPKGTHVMDAKSTKKYAGIGHIPAYANGTAWDWTKEKISGGINWVAEKIKSLVDVKNKVLGFVAKKIGFDEKSISNQFIKGGGTKLINDASSRIFGGKKHLDISEATAIANSGSSNFTGGMAAAGGGRINGVMGDLVRLVRNVISKYPRAVITSGYRPGARTEAGNYSDHATGRAMDISGYGSFGHPMYTKMADELFQSPITKYVIANNRWKYKNRFGYQHFPWGGHMNHVHVSAFKRGGFVNKPTLAMAGEAGPESIIPMSKSLRTRGLSLLHDTARQMGMEVQEKGKRNIPTSENVYNINLNYTGSASKEDAMTMAQIVMDEIEKRERRNRRARGEK